MVTLDAASPPFTTSQARSAAITAERLADAVAAGVLVRPFIGVYVGSAVELTPLLRAQAAALVMSPHSVVCDRTAAWIHGVPCHPFAAYDVGPPFESCVLRGHDPTDRAECRGRTRNLLSEDITEVGGILVTTPLRTAMDLGCQLRPREAVAVMDALMRLHGFTHVEMHRLMLRYRRRRGVVQLRHLVPLVDPGAGSFAESWARLEIHAAGLPRPVLQHWVDDEGGPVYRLDLAYPRAKVAVEYDGAEFHSSPEDRAYDERRRAWLRDRGWHIIVLTKESFSSEAVLAWTAELWSVLRERAERWA